MALKYLLASTAVLGFAMTGPSEAAPAPGDLAACVWDATPDAERNTLAAQPHQATPQGESFDQIAQTHPSASAAIDRCRGGGTVPTLWKGHLLTSLGMEHWAAAQLTTKQTIDADRLEKAWDAIPPDLQICYGVLTAWAIASTDKTAEPYLSAMPMRGCTQAPAKAAMQVFMQTLGFDPQSEAAGLAGMYALGKGGEAVVIRLIAATGTKS